MNKIKIKLLFNLNRINSILKNIILIQKFAHVLIRQIEYTDEYIS